MSMTKEQQAVCDKYLGKKEVGLVVYIKRSDITLNNAFYVEEELLDMTQIRKRDILDFCNWLNENICKNYITGDEVNEYFKDGLNNEN